MTVKTTCRRRVLFRPALAAGASLVLPSPLIHAAEVDEPLFEGIMQISWIVPDLQAAMRDYTERLGIGPWFLSEHFNPSGMLYRGKPSEADVSIAMTFSGHMNFELIQQHDEKPSVYRETFLKRGYGFHHWAVASLDFERDVQSHLASGDEVILEITLEGGNRVVYVDTSAYLDGMLEIIEVTEGVRSAFGDMYRICRQWDGRDLIFRG